MEKSFYNSSLKNAAGSTKIITISNPKRQPLQPKPTQRCKKKSSQPTFSTPSVVTWYKLLKLVLSIVTSKFWRKL